MDPIKPSEIPSHVVLLFYCVALTLPLNQRWKSSYVFQNDFQQLPESTSEIFAAQYL